MGERNPKRFDPLLWLMAVVAGGLLLLVLVPNNVHDDGFFDRFRRKRPSTRRPRVGMRMLATAIEAYYVDNGRYPAWATGDKGPGGTESYNYRTAQSLRREDDPATLPTFALNGKAPGKRFMTLTTPIAYITSFPDDTLSPLRKATFVYWSVHPGEPGPGGDVLVKETQFGVGWILISAGPDRDYDIPGDWNAYDPRIPQPSPWLLTGKNKKGSSFTYDITNGTISDGDIWRVKQR